MKNLRAIFFSALLFPLLSFGQIQKSTSDTLNYSAMLNGEIKGSQQLIIKNDTQYEMRFQYNDRGRGDSVTATMHTKANGQLTFFQCTGVDYYKNPYNELYTIKNDSAMSVVNGEKKEKLFHGEIYFPNEIPATVEPGLKVLMNHINDSVTYFPEGKVLMRPLHKMQFMQNGKTISLILCEYYFDKNNPPNFTWLSDDHHFFGFASDWFSVIRKGYEGLHDQLMTAQAVQSEPFYSRQEDSLSTPLAKNIAIQNVRLFDAMNATMQDGMTVLVSNGMVTQVGKSSGVQVPKDYKVIDGTNKTLMPGLWDMHSHYDKSDGLNYIAGGVTHIRDMGNTKSLLVTKKEIDSNLLLGPSVSYMSGFIDQAGPFQGPTGTIVHSLAEGIKAEDDYHSLGYQQIKLYSSIDPKWVTPMAAEAHRLGMHVAGHVPSFMTATDAINDGYDEITHMNFIMLNFLGDTMDTRGRGRFYVTGDRAKDIDMNSDAVKTFVTLMKTKHISVDPTMNTFSEMYTEFPGDTTAIFKPIISWLPQQMKDNLKMQSTFAPIDKKPAYTASFANMMKMLKLLYDNGILIVAGTDGEDALAVDHELELYVKAGIPAIKVLQIATYNAALDCKLQNQFGSIGTGMPADMILIDGNPAENISSIRDVRWVIKNNRVYEPKKLLASVGWGYYY
jgi:hypothetical protein